MAAKGEYEGEVAFKLRALKSDSQGRSIRKAQRKIRKRLKKKDKKKTSALRG